MREEIKTALVVLITLVGLVVEFDFNEAFAFKFTPKVCSKYRLGRNWYCEQEGGEEVEPTAQDILNSNILPEQKAVILNTLWERQLKKATITANKKDIENFLEVRNLITFKGIEFARNVQRIIETSPRFGSGESYYNNLVEMQIQEEENKELLRQASKRYGLVFVYSAGCAHCARQLPILLRFKEENNFKILGVTEDDSYFEGLDENITGFRINDDPLIQAYPTILLLDKQLGQKIFISKGLTTLDELEEKVVKRIREREDLLKRGKDA